MIVRPSADIRARPAEVKPAVTTAVEPGSAGVPTSEK